MYRTLEALRNELSARLGFGGAIGAGALNAPILDSFLRNAQDGVWWAVDWAHLTKNVALYIGEGQATMEYPTDCQQQRVKYIAVLDKGDWRQLERGITLENRSDLIADIPRKWEPFNPIELWPVPDTLYSARIEYIANPARLTMDSDRFSVPDDLVLVHAIANAKGHYRHPDAGQYAGQFNSMMRQVKERSRSQVKFSRKSESIDPYSRPVR